MTLHKRDLEIMDIQLESIFLKSGGGVTFSIVELQMLTDAFYCHNSLQHSPNWIDSFACVLNQRINWVVPARIHRFDNAKQF